jgi:hypothetical protein
MSKATSKCHVSAAQDNTPCESVNAFLKTLRFHRFGRAKSQFERIQRFEFE